MAGARLKGDLTRRAKPKDSVRCYRPLIASIVVGLAVLLVGVALAGCGSSKVTWYVTDGLEVVEGKVQFRLAEVTKAAYGVSPEKLTQLALDCDPSFFSGAASGERVGLDGPLSEKSLTLYLYANGYKELAKILIAFELHGDPPQSAGD